MATTTIDIEKFIGEVHARPAIWHMQHADYADKCKRRRAWDEIIDIFMNENESSEERKEMADLLQKKWKNLRDRYCRDMQKRKGKSGQAAKTTPRYMYSEQLSFLQDTIQPRPTSSSLDNEIEDDDSLSQNTEIVDTEPSRPSSRDTPEVTTGTVIGKKRKLPPVEAKLIEALERNILRREEKSTKHEVGDDDDKMFLLSLAPQLKLVPSHLKLQARIDIMQAINKHVISAAGATVTSNHSFQPLSQLQQPYSSSQQTHSARHHPYSAQFNRDTLQNLPQTHTQQSTHFAHTQRIFEQLQNPLQSPTESIQSFVSSYSADDSEGDIH